ncbi:MAG: FmdE family protein [Thermoplasmata archaeon]
MKKNPREHIWNLLEKGESIELLKRAAVLHGHYCPGLALGVNASVTAFSELGLEHSGLEDVLVVVETNNCFSDGVQYVTGCSFGNNSLIFRDLGKTAATFVKRGNKGLRLLTKSDAREEWAGRFSEYGELFSKVVKERKGTEEDRARMMEMAQDISKFVVNIESEKLFEMKTADVELPDYAPINDSYTCDNCGESVMSTRTVERDGRTYCLLCGGGEYFELNGHGMRRRGGKNEK